MPNINVICLHGLQSHPDILANAMHKIESLCVEKIVTSSVSSDSSLNRISFSYPCAPVPVERTFTMKGEVVPVEKSCIQNNNNQQEDSHQNESNFEKIQLFGWTPADCVCCQSVKAVEEKNAATNNNNNSSSTPCFSTYGGKDKSNHFKPAFDIVMNEIERVCSANDEQENYFVLLGFSQGGIILQTLVTALFADPSKLKQPTNQLVQNLVGISTSTLFGDEATKTKYKNLFLKHCAGLIFSGSPVVLPDESSCYNNFFSTVPSLHIIGQNDKLVQPDNSMKALKFFSCPQDQSQHHHEPSLFLHEGGHPIPTTSKAIEAFFTFFQQRCLVVAHQKKWFHFSSSSTSSSTSSMTQKQKEALDELQQALTEELEVVTCALPEGSNVSCVINDQVLAKSRLGWNNNTTTTPSSPLSPATSLKKATSSIIDPCPCVDVLIEMMLPGLDDDEQIREAFFATLSKKSLRMKAKKWSTASKNASDDDDDDDDEDEDVSNNKNSALIQKQGMVRLTIKVPLGYPTETTTVPRCVLSSLPPLLAIQSHRNAQLLSAVYDSCHDLAGSPMVMNICLCVLAELESWVSAATSQILEGGLSRADSSEDDFLEKAAVMNDPWLVEMDEDERDQIVCEAHKIVEEELSSLESVAAKTSASAKKSSSSSSSSSITASSAASSIITQNPGEWKFVIAFCGKPSSGKSSTWNSMTDPESESQAAKVGAFPFTTIEPNIGRAWCGVPCPCRLVFGKKEEDAFCAACYGHLPDLSPSSDESTLRFRRHPIEIRDVAGLVKGAYKGRGKGNKFLNDLCDADVLVHVVDGSGRSTAEGVELKDSDNANSNNTNTDAEGASDPTDDVEWIRNEIHNWIYDNVEAKWSTIRVKPKKLLAMFTGYHANLRLTEIALERCGVKLNEIDVRIPAWTPRDLHKLIAHFIRLRFPILLAINKVDVSGCVARAKKVSDRYPSHVVKTMSARVENELLRLRREGKIHYSAGGNDFQIVDESKLSEKERTAQIPALKKFLGKFHSTGVHEVLAAAISLRPPLLCYPLDSDPARVIQSYKSTRDLLIEQNNNNTIIDQRMQAQRNMFRDCLTLRPGTTAEVAFKTAARLGLLDSNNNNNQAGTGAGTTATSAAGFVNANRYHEYSLVRCDVVEIPPNIIWNGVTVAQICHHQSTVSSSSDDNKIDNTSSGENVALVGNWRKSVCRKDEVLPQVAVVRMVGKKG